MGVIINNVLNYLFNPNIGYIAKHRYFYVEGVPHTYYIIYHCYRWCGIPFADRITFCIDMLEVSNFTKSKSITIK